MDVPLDQFIFNHILGLVQNAIVKNTDEDVVVQRDGLYQRMIPIIEAAALAKVNVLCFQEAWSKKFKIKPCIFTRQYRLHLSRPSRA